MPPGSWCSTDFGSSSHSSQWWCCPAPKDRALVLDCINRGAMGFIGKSVTGAMLADALRLVFSGGVYLPPALIAQTRPPSLGKPAPKRMAQGASLPATYSNRDPARCRDAWSGISLSRGDEVRRRATERAPSSRHAHPQNSMNDGTSPEHYAVFNSRRLHSACPNSQVLGPPKGGPSTCGLPQIRARARLGGLVAEGRVRLSWARAARVRGRRTMGRVRAVSRLLFHGTSDVEP
jgi:hypothetical protein